MKIMIELSGEELQNAQTSELVLALIGRSNSKEAIEVTGPVNYQPSAIPQSPSFIPQAPVQNFEQPVPMQPIYGGAPVQPIYPQQQQPQQIAPMQQPYGQQPVIQPQQMPGAVPLSGAPTYTMDQLAVAATQLTDAGRRGEVVALLSTFGIQALTQLPKEHYGTFAIKLREMGAKI